MKWWAAFVIAAELHAIAIVALPNGRNTAPPSADTPATFDVAFEPESAPNHGRGATASVPAPRRSARRPPPQAARPGAVLQHDDGPALATGPAVAAGGVTQAGATNAKYTDDARARACGVPGGDGDGSGGTGPDRSQPAHLGPNRNWHCPDAFASLQEFIGQATVRAQAEVAADGSAIRVEILDAPSPLFASAAERCVLRERFVPARDRDDRAARGHTLPFRVVLSRD